MAEQETDEHKTKKYWFEEFLKPFFYNCDFKILEVNVNQALARDLIYNMCDIILISTKKREKEKKEIKNKAYNNLRKIICHLPTKKKEKPKRSTNKKNGNDDSVKYNVKDIIVYKREHCRYPLEYEMSLLQFTFLQLEVYYTVFFKNEIYENYHRFSKCQRKPLEASFKLAREKKLDRTMFSHLQNSKLQTAQDYYENLTLFFDIWQSLTTYDMEYIEKNNSKLSELDRKKVIISNKETFNNLTTLLKNYYFMYFIYPFYYDFEISMQYEQHKKKYKKELTRIRSQKFQIIKDNKNIQPPSKSRNLLCQNTEEILKLAEEEVKADHFQSYSNVLGSILVDYETYKKSKE